ncbi:MAG TPA: oligosaccharide flippase family protein [Herpetosiphonaceae bacterium]|nr:oligosaccharide flippase family protein [Herpetosiphonaceae bacterium]
MSQAPRRRSLTQEVWSATLWNTLLMPIRIVVGFGASAIYFDLLSYDQVALLLLITSLAASVGMYADLGIERTLPRYLPEIERQSGRRGVRRFLARMIGLKVAILAVLILGLTLLATPMADYLIKDQRKEIAGLSEDIAKLSALPGSAETDLQISALEGQIAGKEQLIEHMHSQARIYLGAVSALLVLGALFDVFMQFLTAYFKQRAWNLITMATTLLQPLLVTTFILFGWGVNGVLLGLVLTPLISVALAGWQVRRASRGLEETALDAAPDPTLPGRFARFAGVSYLLQITTWIYDIQFVTFIALALFTQRELAILGFAYKFAKDFLGYVWMPLSGLMTPLLARIKLRRDATSLRDAHASLTRMIWLIVVPAGVGLALLAPRLIALIYPDYRDAAALTIVFIAFTFGESLLSVPHNVLMVYEQYRAVIVSRLLAFSVIPLVFVMMPRYGLLGVAIAVGVVRVATRLVTVIYGVRRLGLTLPAGFALRVVAASASFAVALLLLMRAWPAAAAAEGFAAKASAAVPLLIFSLVGAVLYVAALRMLGGLDPAERERLLGMRLPFKRVLAKVL